MTDEPIFDVAVLRDGCVKVRLFYHTWEPRHIRSHYLRTEVGVEPPFTEDIAVLVPFEEAYDRLSTYQDIFINLKIANWLAVRDELRGYEICEEDTHTLAYFQKESNAC